MSFSCLYKQVTIELLILGASLMWPNPIPISHPSRVGYRETPVTIICSPSWTLTFDNFDSKVSQIWGNLKLRRTRELRCGGRLQKRLRSGDLEAACRDSSHKRCGCRESCSWVRVDEVAKLCITSSTAQGGGGSFKKRKTIGEIGCCESRMSKQKH